MSLEYDAEKEQAIRIYLETDRCDSSKLDAYREEMWYYGRACYAERCKAMMKAAVES